MWGERSGAFCSVGTSMSKGFLDNGVPETIKGRNILGQRLRPGVFKEKQIL